MWLMKYSLLLRISTIESRHQGAMSLTTIWIKFPVFRTCPSRTYHSGTWLRIVCVTVQDLNPNQGPHQQHSPAETFHLPKIRLFTLSITYVLETSLNPKNTGCSEWQIQFNHSQGLKEETHALCNECMGCRSESLRDWRVEGRELCVDVGASLTVVRPKRLGSFWNALRRARA